MVSQSGVDGGDPYFGGSRTGSFIEGFPTPLPLYIPLERHLRNGDGYEELSGQVGRGNVTNMGGLSVRVDW